jgi:DNA uptake protein ComE-like DNA-binding protein
MINAFIRDYFGFNKQQRNGLIVLIALSFLLLIVRVAFPYFIRPDNIVIENLPLVERKMDSAFEKSKIFSHARFRDTPKVFKGFVFDPNTVSFDQLIKLGFREKTAKTFLKFRSKGFVFKEKKDLLKIYGISTDFYENLEPYVLISSKDDLALKSEKKKSEEKISIATKRQVKITVELNSADSLALIAMQGVGPAYAKRILKYRSILGGYVSIEQLKEVYGFTDDLYESIKPFCTVNTSTIKKINLNKDDFKAVNKHPYLTYEITKQIFDWRRKTSINPTNLKEILNDNSLYQKVLPYLTFE